eukprot:CAMPEP_0172592958 /NCGR_PEP_ID=MMETSP1068-20121228/12120_1 /TAXON_ID=35684 /ORGANISM="Pseudopedinella elastica, Strain CCMP716" /LENGTH=79 /DNA_ID=CAMNT_0013390271 /DNA_START=46 /DNA_END=281 /DNA_ORIENTATION=+
MTSRAEIGARQAHVELDAITADTQGCVQTSRGDTEAEGFVRAQITLAWFKCNTHRRRGVRHHVRRVGLSQGRATQGDFT